MHETLGQKRLNFLKKKFFNYKTEISESIDEIFSELFRLQLIIQNIKIFETSTNLNVALIFINSMNNEVYALAKFHLKDMEDLILTHIKKRLKLIKQRIKDDSITDEKINKSETTSIKKNRESYFYKKKKQLKSTSDDAQATQKKKKNENDVFMIKKNHALATEHLFFSDMWIIDSNVTKHMTSNESLFINKIVINTKVTMTSGDVLRANDIDDVRVFLKGHIIKMKKMLHVSELNANLFSISIFDKRDFNVLFKKGVVEIRSKNTLMIIEIMKRKMYLFRSIDRALLISEISETAPETISEAASIFENFTSETANTENLMKAPPILKNSTFSKQKSFSSDEAPVMKAENQKF